MAVPAFAPVEERILADVVATCAAISTSSLAADFYSNVAVVHSMDIGPLETQEWPAICLVHEGTDEDYADVTDVIDCRLKLDLYCVIPRETDSWRTDIEKLAADVRKALRVDFGRGQSNGDRNAFDTVIGRTDIAQETEGMNVAMARIGVLIQFRHLISDPSVAA